jgi:cytoskeletal protein CcmA (bactofilin family)
MAGFHCYTASMSEPTDRQESPSRATNEALPVTVIGSEIDVVGSIFVDNHVCLEGSVDGEIRCTTLDVTKDAHVVGVVVAEHVIVHGAVNGRIYAYRLQLPAGCRVEGEIYYAHLELESGAYFEGKSRRVPDPIKLAPE